MCYCNQDIRTPFCHACAGKMYSDIQILQSKLTKTETETKRLKEENEILRENFGYLEKNLEITVYGMTLSDIRGLKAEIKRLQEVEELVDTLMNRINVEEFTNEKLREEHERLLAYTNSLEDSDKSWRDTYTVENKYLKSVNKKLSEEYEELAWKHHYALIDQQRAEYEEAIKAAKVCGDWKRRALVAEYALTELKEKQK